MDNSFQDIWKIQLFKKKSISVLNILNEKNKLNPTWFLKPILKIKIDGYQKNMTSTLH
jgi:hypothetical protein